MTRIATFALVIGSIVLPPVAATPAMAQDFSASVRTNDIDLSSADGQATLNRRVATVARRQCAATGERSIAARNAEQACLNSIRTHGRP